MAAKPIPITAFAESYRLENKIRHRHILNLGGVEELTYHR